MTNQPVSYSLMQSLFSSLSIEWRESVNVLLNSGFHLVILNKSELKTEKGWDRKRIGNG